MFHDEAEILSKLSHDNITRTFEVGEESGHHFIAMELLLGRTLVDVWEACVAKKLSLRLDLSAWIAARVAEGLDHAHALKDAKGQSLRVIHRDVNPSNVFLTYDGQVKLFDFGLAKSLGRRAQSSAGVVKGKLPYLSPEQVMQLDIDHRSDIFMLGTTLWEMTTMRRLFKRPTDVDTVKAVRNAPIPDARKIVAGYPDALFSIVDKALQRNRENRYQVAGAFARELDAFVGPSGDMGSLIAPILESLFPGDRARQMGWLKSTSALPRGAAGPTIPPPVPLPETNERDKG
jgi:serine/threonine-protein kinase